MQCYQRIRMLRENAKMTQADAAKALFMQREQYRRYETGEREIPFYIAIAIANLFGVSLDYIAERTNNPKIPDT